MPFRIPTTCGQQKSLPWIRNEELDNPSGPLGVIGRMALEVLTFRSLFRNHTGRARARAGEGLVYVASKYLWAAALAFHWSMLLIVLRHFRFFVEPVPACGQLARSSCDGFFQVGVPVIYLTDAWPSSPPWRTCWLRRLVDAKLRYISLPADYFALFLLLGIAASGILMRHFDKVDIVAGQGAGDRAGDVRCRRYPDGVGAAVLRPPLPGQRAARLLPVLQADAHGRASS